MKEDMSELKKRALAIVDIYSDLNRITEREANILREAITAERPQGKWENICTLPIIRKCSLCGNEIGNEMGFYNNFCPKCGADMRKGGAE